MTGMVQQRMNKDVGKRKESQWKLALEELRGVGPSA